MIARTLFVTVAMLTAGCVSVLPEAKPAPATYRLSPQLAAAANTQRSAPSEERHVVTVYRPLAASSLSTDRIAVMSEDGVIAYAAGALWENPTPELVHDAVIAALDTADIATVRPEDGVRADLTLRMELVAFEAEYGDRNSPPTVQIAIRSRLVDASTRQLLATRTFDGQAAAQRDSLPAIIAAFDQASGAVLADLARWASSNASAQRLAQTPTP